MTEGYDLSFLYTACLFVQGCCKVVVGTSFSTDGRAEAGPYDILHRPYSYASIPQQLYCSLDCVTSGKYAFIKNALDEPRIFDESISLQISCYNTNTHHPYKRGG